MIRIRINDDPSLPADVLWGSFVMRDKRTPKDVCGEAMMIQDHSDHDASKGTANHKSHLDEGSSVT